jgi:transcription termination factor NusB
MANVLVQNGRIVGTTELSKVSGFTVLPAPVNWDGDVNKLRLEGEKVVLIPEEEYQEKHRQELIEARIKALNEATDTYFYREAAQRGDYKNMGEIVYDAQQGDEDAEFLLRLYDAICEKEEELEKQLQEMSLSELEQINVYELAGSTYDQVKENLESGE